MEIIPVIDLKDGQAVHARRGLRDAYQPVRSPLCQSSDPLEVAQSFLAIHPFAKLYLADLDAIQGRGDNLAVLERLRAALPALRLWVDSGLADEAACRAWLARGLGDLVLGSESQADAGLLDRLVPYAAAGRVILSLDFQGQRFLGPDAILAACASWPGDVIVITLARVGAGLGPDLDRLRGIRASVPNGRVYAGGGVRDVADLLALRKAGIAGALVATALHDGRIGAAEIESLHCDRPGGAIMGSK